MKVLAIVLIGFLMLGCDVKSNSKEGSNVPKEVLHIVQKEGNEVGRYQMAVVQATERSSKSIFFLDTKEGHIWSYYMVTSPTDINVSHPYLAYVAKLRVETPRVNLLQK